MARVFALKVLYENDAVGHSTEAALAWLLKEDLIPSEVSAFAQGLIHGVSDSRDKIDRLIWEYAPAWPVEQISIVDRNILRIAVFEILYQRLAPPKAVINEAVELAKTFGSESSPRFVNGVLGSLMNRDEVLADIVTGKRG